MWRPKVDAETPSLSLFHLILRARVPETNPELAHRASLASLLWGYRFHLLRPELQVDEVLLLG